MLSASGFMILRCDHATKKQNLKSPLVQPETCLALPT